MTEKMKETRDNKKLCAAVLTGLSKAFDYLLKLCILIACESYPCISKWLDLSNKVDSFYSGILQIIYGVPQGSILSPL